MPEEYKFFLFVPFLLQEEVPKMLWDIFFKQAVVFWGLIKLGNTQTLLSVRNSRSQCWC